MDFEIKQKTKIKVGIYGNEYELKKLTVSDTDKLLKLQKSDESNYLESSKQYLEILGMPKPVLDEMEVDHFVELINFITTHTAKKN